MFKQISKFAFVLFAFTVISPLIIYFGQYGGAVLAGDSDCEGWECETVDCPAGYAVQITEFHFLPCDEFYEFTKNGDTSVLAIRRDLK